MASALFESRYCPICYETLADPFVHEGGEQHPICKSCWKKWIITQWATEKKIADCPICKEKAPKLYPAPAKRWNPFPLVALGLVGSFAALMPPFAASVFLGGAAFMATSQPDTDPNKTGLALGAVAAAAALAANRGIENASLFFFTPWAVSNFCRN